MPPDLANILAGEANTCQLVAYHTANGLTVVALPAAMGQFMAYIAVAHVYSHNSRMHGYYDNPPPLALSAANIWQQVSDPTGGGVYLFSRADMRLAEVRDIVRGRDPTAILDCAGLNDIYIFN
jgi:hypothetical protein